MLNPNLALAAIHVSFPSDDDFDALDTDMKWSKAELARLETYGVVATATVYLKVYEDRYQILQVETSVWGVSVFCEDRSYLGECAREEVDELRCALEALGVPLPSGDLPFYEVHGPGDHKLLPSPREAFSGRVLT